MPGNRRRKLKPQHSEQQDPPQLSQPAVSSPTFSSNTGVSMTSAPWRLKHEMMALKALSRMAISLGPKSRVPWHEGRKGARDTLG